MNEIFYLFIFVLSLQNPGFSLGGWMFLIFIYLSVPGLSCSVWNLYDLSHQGCPTCGLFSLQHVGFFFLFFSCRCKHQGFPGGSDGQVSVCNAGDLDSIPGLRRSPGEGNGNPLQYSCLENPKDGGAW